MAIDKHTMQVVDGSSAIFTDRTIVGVLTGVVNASGGAGVAITTAVTFSEPLPPVYAVFVTPSQFAWASVSAKTSAGFNVVLTPIAANSIAAGTFDVLVVA